MFMNLIIIVTLLWQSYSSAYLPSWRIRIKKNLLKSMKTTKDLCLP